MLREFRIEPAQQFSHALLSVFKPSGRDRGILHLCLRLFRDEEVPIRCLSRASFLQALLNTITGWSLSTIDLAWSSIAVSTAVEACILLHSLSDVNCSIKRKAVRIHMLPGTCNMIGFAG